MFERFRARRGEHVERSERVERSEPRAAARERQHSEYGGANWGAAFFGWLVAVGIGVILTALAAAAGAAIGLTEVGVAEATQEAETIGIVGAIVLIAITLIAYFAGGYVAGRMSRFDGGRQGAAVWVVSLLIAVVFAIAGAIGGAEYNVFGGLDLPRIPIEEGSLTTGGVIALIVMLVVSLLAALSGGKAGESYHRRVDRAGLAAAEDRERRPVAGERARDERRPEREPRPS